MYLLLLSKQYRLQVYFFLFNSKGWSILEVYLKYTWSIPQVTWSIFEVYLKYASLY